MDQLTEDLAFHTLSNEQLAAHYHDTHHEDYLKQIFDRTHRLLISTARKLTTHNHRVEADEVVQDTFHAFAEFCRRERVVSVVAWLLRRLELDIHAHCRYHDRAKRGRDCVTPLRPGHSKMVGNTEPPDARILAQEATEATYRLLTAVGGEEAETIRLVHLEGMMLNEAAEVVGVSLATVKRRLKSGMERLRARHR